MRTPTETSPWNYFQERYRDDPWKLLVVVSLLNQTSGKQVEKIHASLFERYPSALQMSLSVEGELATFLKPLGLQNRRAKVLRKMSASFIEATSKTDDPKTIDVSELHGCGKYATDSYKLFIVGELPGSPDEVDDKELKRYVDWALKR